MTVRVADRATEQLLRRGRDARSFVVDIDRDAVVGGTRGHLHFAASVARGIVDEDVEDLARRDRRNLWGGKRGLSLNSERAAVGREPSVPALLEVVERRLHVERCPVTAGVACQSEQLDDGRLEAVSLLDRLPDHFVFRGSRVRGGFECDSETRDACAQLVRHIGAERPLAVEGGAESPGGGVDRLGDAVDLGDAAAWRAGCEVAVSDLVGGCRQARQGGIEAPAQPPGERGG